LQWQFIFRYDTHCTSSLIWYHAVMSCLRFTHIRSFACRGRLRNVGTDCSTNSFILCEKMQGRRRAGKWRGHFPPALSKGGGAFFITVLWISSWFGKIELKQIYCSYSRNKKIQNGFQSFPLLFLRSILLLNRNKNIGKDLLVFYKFPFPSTFILPPTVVLACLKRSMSEKEASLPTKRIFLNQCSL